MSNAQNPYNNAVILRYFPMHKACTEVRYLIFPEISTYAIRLTQDVVGRRDVDFVPVFYIKS